MEGRDPDFSSMYAFNRKAVMLTNDSSMAYRARKAGESLKAKKKLEQQYDDDDKAGIPANIAEWINATLDGDHPKFENYAGPSGEGVSWRKFQFFLRDGVAICRLLNKLLSADGKDHMKFNAANTSSTYVALENIDNFIKAVETYGVGKDSLFTSADLYEGQKGPFAGVMRCLHQLGVLANSKDFETKYKVQEAAASSDAPEKNGAEET